MGLVNASETEALLLKADCLDNMLVYCLSHYHIPNQVPHSKHQHWCMDWVKDNIAVVVVYMILFKHTKKYIRKLGKTSCILTQLSDNNYLPCVYFEGEGPLYGAHLSYEILQSIPI